MRLLLPLFVLIGTSMMAQVPRVKWFYDVNDMSFGQSATADLDNDGILEIAFSNYRNDSNIYVLKGDNGQLFWKYNTGGCNDVAPLIHDVDQDGDLEIVLPGSCNPTTFCFDADSGYVQWQTPTRGSDSPPTIGDIDNDGKLEILHGQFGGWVVCLNGEDGSKSWDIPVDTNGWIQTAPAMLDVDGNGQLDFVVANWDFGTDDRVYCFRGDNQQLIWQDTMPEDYMYHGTSWGDMDNDGKPELVIGDYNANLFCYNAEDGSMAWQYSLPSAGYFGAATSMADLDNNGKLDVVFTGSGIVGALNDTGAVLWTFPVPSAGQSFRGTAIADINGDNVLDVTFGTSTGMVYGLDGMTGSVIRSIDLQAHYGNSFKIDHAPVVADFDGDDTLDLFIVGGHAEYPAIQNNYGRGYAIVWGKGNGPEWRMFRRDYRRSACICNDSLLTVGVPENHPQISDAMIFPNPGSQQLHVRFTTSNNSMATINMYNMQGQLVYASGPRSFTKGVQTYTLNSNTLPASSGVYYIELQGDFGKQVFKYIHQK